jgi:predicted metal-dependent enzyme (double-stranded beta helix superfamily)
LSVAIARLRDFVVQLTTIIDQDGDDEGLILAQAKPLLAALVKDDDWLPSAFAEPDPQRYRQFLLHADPRERLSIVSFVWGPGQGTPIHDHTVWGLVGVLRGAERNQAYRREADGTLIKEGSETLLRRGEVVAVSPALGDIHAVRNALDDQPSVSIHVYGGNIGAVRRSTFNPADGTGKLFISGYTNNVVPNLWDRSGNQAR